MPYEGELASKASHMDMLRNPEVRAFLDECEYLKPPSEEESAAIGKRFQVPPACDQAMLPDRVIAIDGSRYEASIDERLPSTKMGYVKTSATLIDMTQFQSLRVMGGRFVDPFRVAKLQESNTPLTFAVPSANVRWRGRESVRDSFRAAVDAHFYDTKTRFNKNDGKTSLRTTLFHLAARRKGEMRTGDPSCLKLHRCPSCEREDVIVYDVPEQQYCPGCGGEIYATDSLRLWEMVAENQSNVAVLTRLMLNVEHLLPMHYIRYFMENSLPVLGGTAFLIDGPMAIFGTSAWLHAAIMGYLADVNDRLQSKGYQRVLMISLQKTGQLVDHLALIERYVEANRIYSLDDEYRYAQVLSMRDPATQGFGYEIYYGQDFLYKTPSGRKFVFGLPYPYASKREAGVDFIQAKAQIENYVDLPRALRLIQHFESDLYQNALIPIALAHRYTAISLSPGGHVLDILTRSVLNGEKATR